jgi:hypothetical protein
MSDTEGSARGKGVAYPSGAPELILGFEWGSCYSIFSFMRCYVDHRLCVVVSFYFGHGVICPSIFDVLNGCSGRVGNSFSTRGTLRVTHVTNSIISNIR